MPEQESGVPQEDQNFKVEGAAPEQEKRSSFKEAISRAKVWLERRNQEKEAHELNREYDTLLMELFRKLEYVNQDILLFNPEGKKGTSSTVEQVELGIQEIRVLIDSIRQFEKDKLGMDSGSSYLEDIANGFEEYVTNYWKPRG